MCYLCKKNEQKSFLGGFAMRRNFLPTLMLLLNTSFAKGFQNNIKSIQKYQWPIDEKQGHDKNAFDEIGACLFWSKSDILWSAERRKWAASRVSGRVRRLDRMGGRRRGVQVKRWNLMGYHPVALAKCDSSVGQQKCDSMATIPCL